ncbi:MAG: sialate O-acetylesterase [Pirellulaceae bacterium]|nr:sialate O-acetylesterase [Pirellulaceae bacterium]
MKRLLTLLLFLASALPLTARGDVKLPKVFGDSMVLQQKTLAAVWGWADKGEEVTVTLGEAKASATAGDNGKWSLKLATPAAGGPFELKIKGKNEITLKDVYVGEVWICSGQSNAEWTVAVSTSPDLERELAKHPKIRMLKVAHNPSEKPVDDIAGQWQVCSPSTASNFSAIGYFFARHLQSELDAPVGIISTNWGGTICEAWTSNEKLKTDPDFAPILQRSEKFQAGNPNQASVLFNGMINPIVPYGIRGAIWYQGESNVSRAVQYRKLFPAMITDWRERFGQGDLPFIFVQLAPYRYGNNLLPEQWESQLKTLSLKNTGMCVTTDIATVGDIHPPNKQDVGRRLALWALANTYERASLPFSGPLYDSMAVEGNKVRIKFKHGGGLHARGNKGLPTHFTIAGEDQKFVDAKATIEGEAVIVESDQVAKPVAVRFGWNELAEPNLFNGARLPASPFRTDEFPLLTKDAK